MSALPDSAISDRFPPFPSVKAEWVPIYLDPIPNSGERITVAVVARSDSGEFHILQTLNEKQARCMYGASSTFVLGVVALIRESLEAHLRRNGTLADWIPPIRNAVFSGALSMGYGDSLSEIARVGRTLTSSLSVGTSDSEDEMEVARVQLETDEWVAQIKEHTLAVRHDFADRFRQSVKLRPDAPPTRIGYLGPRLAAQFGRLIPGRQLSYSRSRAKAALTELQMLRDVDENSTVGKRTFYELLLWVPPESAVQYSAQQRDDARGAAREMESFADRHELRVESLHDSSVAAQRILRAETIGG